MLEHWPAPHQVIERLFETVVFSVNTLALLGTPIIAAIVQHQLQSFSP
jgi:hypothetical protein